MADATAGQDITLSAGSDVTANGNLNAGTDIDATAGDNILLMADATAGQDITLSAGSDVTANGNLNAEDDITISSADFTTYLGGNLFAGHDILLNNNTIVDGYGDQTLEAGNKLTAMGFLRKVTFGDMYLIGNSDDLSIDLRYDGEGPGTSTCFGNLWILGYGDIQISGDVTTSGPSYIFWIDSEIPIQWLTGGVAILSETGKIYTDGANGALNVSVTGSSDQLNNSGVYNFYNYGQIEPTLITESEGTQSRAAIAIVSADPLTLGPDARLTATGTYYDNVDDRAAIGFLDVPAEIPAGTPRNQGDPFDLAIYTASKNGPVTINCPVTITSSEPGPVILPTIEGVTIEQQQPIAKGAMVIDAHDVVTLGDNFKQSLANGDVGDRLEVCSRITEWLDDAIGRLPFASDLILPTGYNYVMRGAGLENPKITDGRAWVLERMATTAVAPIQQYQLASTGCPAVMNWAAKELGLEADQIQIYVAGALALSGSVQPCEACANLKNAALALKDADGSEVKALAQVINEVTGAGAPPSEEQMATIATTLSNPKEGTQYALAEQWLNAMAEYVNILHNEFQMPAKEAVTYVSKYTAPVVNGNDAALSAFVQARLAALSE